MNVGGCCHEACPLSSCDLFVCAVSAEMMTCCMCQREIHSLVSDVMQRKVLFNTERGHKVLDRENQS